MTGKLFIIHLFMNCSVVKTWGRGCLNSSDKTSQKRQKTKKERKLSGGRLLIHFQTEVSMGISLVLCGGWMMAFVYSTKLSGAALVWQIFLLLFSQPLLTVNFHRNHQTKPFNKYQVSHANPLGFSFLLTPRVASWLPNPVWPALFLLTVGCPTQISR